MKNVVSSGNAGPLFQMFSPVHYMTLAVLLVIYIVLYFTRNSFKWNTTDKVVRYFAAAVLILLEAGSTIHDVLTGSWSWAYSLPLQLCDISVFLSALMLVTKNFRLYEYVYFLGLAGASQALITPDLAQGFPGFLFFEFFIAHGLIIFSALYMTWVHAYRPGIKSILRTFLTLNLSLPFIGLVDYLTGGDYFFLAWKPDISLLDYLGPWPWYILSLEFVALILFFLLYVPFAVPNKKFRQENAGERRNI